MEPGKGSEFFFELPLPADVGPEPEVRPSAEIRDFKGCRLLVVEDDSTNRMVARLVLEQAGFEVALVADGRQAVEAVQSDPFDAVLMDLDMPVMDGFEATRSIRKLEAFEELPIIAMTANAIRGVREECLSHGMTDYVTKPIQVDELLATLSRWLERVDPEPQPVAPSPPELPGLDVKQALGRLNLDFPRYRDVLLSLHGSYQARKDELRGSLARGGLRAAEGARPPSERFGCQRLGFALERGGGSSGDGGPRG